MMIPIETWILYITTIVFLMATPGPSHLLMLSNSATYGFKRSVATALGDLSANTLQMILVGLGLGVLLTQSPASLLIVKWGGVIYLSWYGIKRIVSAREMSLTEDLSKQMASWSSLYLQGFLTSATNPKAIFFFTALFPQFIAADLQFALQFTALSLTYLLVDGSFLAIHGALGLGLVKLVEPYGTIWIDRLGGIFLLIAALLLSLRSASL